jgi:hypothetical protein
LLGRCRAVAGPKRFRFNDGYLPTLMVVTAGKHREVGTARQQTFAPGTILVFDRGYLHFGWLPS